MIHEYRLRRSDYRFVASAVYTSLFGMGFWIVMNIIISDVIT